MQPEGSAYWSVQYNHCCCSLGNMPASCLRFKIWLVQVYVSYTAVEVLQVTHVENWTSELIARLNTKVQLKQHSFLWVLFLCLFHSGPASHPAADPPWLHLWLKPGAAHNRPFVSLKNVLFYFLLENRGRHREGWGSWDSFKSCHVIYVSFVGRIMCQKLSLLYN